MVVTSVIRSPRAPIDADQLRRVLAEERLAAAHEAHALHAHRPHLVEERFEAVPGELEVARADLRGRAEEAVDVAAVLPGDLDDPRRLPRGRSGDRGEDRGLLVPAQPFPRVRHSESLWGQVSFFRMHRPKPKNRDLTPVEFGNRSRRALADLCRLGGAVRVARPPVRRRRPRAGRGGPRAVASPLHRRGRSARPALRSGRPLSDRGPVARDRGCAGRARPRRTRSSRTSRSRTSRGAPPCARRPPTAVSRSGTGSCSRATRFSGPRRPGVLHPATWLGLWLPVSLSFTFSCAFTLLLALLSAFLLFSDFRLGPRAAMAGAVGWGFSTWMLFWVGWSVGPSTATFPLLLLGLRRLARSPGRASIGLTAAALWLSFCGGHPESFFHGVAAGGVYFLWELYAVRRRGAGRPLAAAFGAAASRPASLRPAALPASRGDPALGGVPRAPRGAREGGFPAVGPCPGSGEASSPRRAAFRPRHLREEPRADAAQRRLGNAARLRGRGALSAGARRARPPLEGRARPVDLRRPRRRWPRLRRERPGPS